VILITYLAHPAQGSPEAEEVEGAYINAWIVEPDFESADRVATAMILENQWVIESVHDWSEVDAETYSVDPTGREYYEQAVIDKQVCVYHTWPHGGDEDQAIQ
jgi:hypothetical protein